jgi:hypothetical protein
MLQGFHSTWRFYNATLAGSFAKFCLRFRNPRLRNGLRLGICQRRMCGAASAFTFEFDRMPFDLFPSVSACTLSS